MVATENCRLFAVSSNYVSQDLNNLSNANYCTTIDCLVKNEHLSTGCSRIYGPILKFYKQQTGKDSTKAIIFSERS